MSLESLSGVDIYILDQVQRGRLTADMRILDAGCGNGRNMRWFLASGAQVFGVDTKPESVAAVRKLAADLAPGIPADNFREEAVDSLSFEDASMDAVICCAVLHFARDDADFDAMVDSLWRVLRPGGVLFCRLASSTGMEDRMVNIEGNRFTMPDGTDRYLVNETRLMDVTHKLGGKLLDPLKTTLVQNLRSMTTWVVRKGESA